MGGLEVLIVEDDEAIAAGLALNLQIEGYRPVRAADGEAAIERVRAVAPDLILLDIGLPGKSGLAVLSELRAAGHATPVIVLSARQDEFDKVAALRLGADDYVTKPFALAELLARCAAVLRRARAVGAGTTPVTPVVDLGGATFDPESRRAWAGGREIPFTRLEQELLAHFVRNPGRLLSREHLLAEVWGASAGSPRTVDNFVAHLRAKLERDPDHPRHIVTVRGGGYRFDP